MEPKILFFIVFSYVVLLTIFTLYSKVHWKFRSLWLSRRDPVLQLDKIIKRIELGANLFLLSRQWRKKHNLMDNSDFIYGEVKIESIYYLLSRIKIKPNTVFYDLGSGRGQVLMSALFFNQFAHCIGIEYVSPLYEYSKMLLERFDRDSAVLEKGKQGKITLIYGDFLQKDFSDAGVVFLNSTCFSPNLFSALVQRFSQLSAGSYVILLSKCIKSDNFVLQHESYLPVSWGHAMFRIYRRV